MFGSPVECLDHQLRKVLNRFLDANTRHLGAVRVRTTCRVSLSVCHDVEDGGVVRAVYRKNVRHVHDANETTTGQHHTKVRQQTCIATLQHGAFVAWTRFH
eukprot:6302697-Amphidinium_carterae.1